MSATSKITESAKGETCTFNLHGICNFNPETTVLCHAPHPDKGMRKKGPDTWAAYGCSECHLEMDGKTYRIDWKQEKYSYDGMPLGKLYFWYHAIRETQRRLIKKGLMPK